MTLWILLAALAWAQDDLPDVQPEPTTDVEEDDDEPEPVEENETALPEPPDTPLPEAEEEQAEREDLPAEQRVGPRRVEGELPRSELEEALRELEPIPPLIPEEEAAAPSATRRAEPAAPGVAPAEPDGDRVEITVFGPAAVRRARAAIVREMADLGYRPVDRGGGVYVFRPPRSWMGRVTLDEDGELTFRRPIIALRNFEAFERERDNEVTNPPGTIEANPNISRTPAGNVFWEGASDEGAGVTLPPLGGTVYVLPSRERLEPIQEAVMEHMAPYLEAYKQARQSTLLVDRLEGVTEQLELLWEQGVPIQGTGGRLATVEERRRAILDFWATRMSNPEGLAVSRVVEQFLRERVQRSRHPATDAEIRRAQAMRQDGRDLLIQPGQVIELEVEEGEGAEPIEQAE